MRRYAVGDRVWLTDRRQQRGQPGFVVRATLSRYGVRLLGAVGDYGVHVVSGDRLRPRDTDAPYRVPEADGPALVHVVGAVLAGLQRCTRCGAALHDPSRDPAYRWRRGARLAAPINGARWRLTDAAPNCTPQGVTE
jgi:hypothetical protein